MRIITFAAAVLISGAVATVAQDTAKVDPSVVDRIVTATFSKAPPEWQARIVQDETQKLCSQYRNQLPPDVFKKVLDAEKASVVMPADGKVLGDWKGGERIAQLGTGGQFSDTAATPKGGNCYACHQLARAELSYGTLGPSLLEYGKIRGYSESAARAAYAKIYDAQAAMPCSTMPRFGHNGFLSEQQIKDAVAYLFDPESPVNR